MVIENALKRKLMAVLFVVAILSLLFIGTASGKIWYVDVNGGADFTKIQDAIDAANESDTIFVYNGSYYERISISKSFILVGENGSSNILGLGSSKCAYITANNVTIDGFAMRNGDYGVYIENNACDIINNSIVENDGDGKVTPLDAPMILQMAAISPVLYSNQYDPSDGEKYLTKADMTNPIIDDFEDADVGDWSLFATQNASINLSLSNNSKSGSYSMRIGCNISGYETNWCGVYRQMDTWVNYDNVSLWVCGDNSGNTLEIKLEEAYNGEWWKYTSIIDWSGWKKLVIPLSSFVAEGAAESIYDKSKINRFTLVVSGNSPPGSTIYVDDIRLELSDMPVSDDDFLEMVEHATFNYFWSEVNQTNGLIRDRSTPDSPCSIASVGFGLSAICIAESRGWVNRTDASDRILTIFETFNNLYNKEGFYYHWINMSTGEREWDCEVSSIDTALLMAGVLHAGEHFKENESIMNLSNELYERVNWTWMLNGTDTIAMKWTPEEGLSSDYWRGYNEAMIMYLLAIGSPTHPVPDPKWSWDAWASTYGRDCGRMVDDFEDNDVSAWVTFADSGSGASIDISRSNNSKIGDYSMKIGYTIGDGTGGERCGAYLQKST
ncbi:MAG: hypothetical protein AEth_01278 [Candidatus Argoarchaeum ethanivorans]|uniref:Right handed beta helix domain-containing protein n=1 Tax=Candidatus Argoarchaeum ethanivorans TaxID=2608793 RepID=A0A8B3S1X0_9EURY|nr:MAG: hypothetical protein AEth_01278 [Candidatus Argoarchaeum ethanivorans]